MNYKCIIIDDEPLARELIERHLSQFDNFEIIGSFENAIKAYQFLETNTIDLMFLDIEMPLLKGNDFLKKLKNKPFVILTTAYREYALEGYELNVVDYLLKPITFDRFFASIEKFKNFQTTKIVDSSVKENYIFIPSGNKKIKIIFSEILYIESFKDYVNIHIENNIKHHIKYNISEFEKILPINFVRVHRSYIINSKVITAYAKYEIETNETKIPIGNSYKDNWENHINNELAVSLAERNKKSKKS